MFLNHSTIVIRSYKLIYFVESTIFLIFPLLFSSNDNLNTSTLQRMRKKLKPNTFGTLKSAENQHHLGKVGMIQVYELIYGSQ